MPTPSILWTEAFTTVVDVWIIWLASAIVFCFGLFRVLKNCSWRRVADFAADERGASYALSYVMTFPAYLLLMCLMIQATLILMVKLGTVYAAHAAARSAIVWQCSQPERSDSSEDRSAFAERTAHRAAALAMAPFASGLKHHLDAEFSLLTMDPVKYGLAHLDAEAYLAMYKQLGEHHAHTDRSPLLGALSRWDRNALALDSYVKNKVKFAYAATEVTFGSDAIPAWNTDCKVTVTYSMPMHVPVVGRVFGDTSRPFYARDITTEAILPSEAPETATKRLNIPYDPRKLVVDPTKLLGL